ncbi:hypothetical protein MKX03_019741, partial [Papaver bracteatum]
MPADRLFKDESIEEKGKRARMSSFVGAMKIVDLVKTTLGPKGMDKILKSSSRGRSITVTNDGATILKSLHIDNTAAKVLLVMITSVVVLCRELLREAEKLVNFRMAAECALNSLLKRVMENKENSKKFMDYLMKIAMTTLSSKIISQDKEHFATLGSTNLESIQVIKKPGGSLKDSFLDEGFILDKKIGIGQLKRIENANILVANSSMDTNSYYYLAFLSSCALIYQLLLRVL